MRVIIQRVKKASCIVDDKVVGSINKGYMLLVGFTHTDTIKEVEKMAQKINNIRLFDDENGKINLNIHDANGEILSISQFTLYGNTHKSNRPSFTDSMNANDAKTLYDFFNELLTKKWQINVETGCFGAHMYLDIECDGPITITLEV